MILMGCKERRSFHLHIIILMSFFLSFSMVHGSIRSYDPESLDASIRNYAMKTLKRGRTGTFVNISLPSNFSGIQASVIRLRSGSLWERGANFSSFFSIPPKVTAFPHVKRLAIVYHNLGNWSSSYYKVAGYSLVAPVVGFMAYDASNLSTLGNQSLKFSIFGEPIVVSFTYVGEFKNGNAELKCVKFFDGGLVQLRNLTQGCTCLTRGDGHFSIVVPVAETKEKKPWVCWVVGFGAGFIGLILVVVIVVTSYKLMRSKTIREMERESDRGVPFDTKWIGRSKMPSASMLRTQPSLENGDIP